MLHDKLQFLVARSGIVQPRIRDDDGVEVFGQVGCGLPVDEAKQQQRANAECTRDGQCPANGG